MSEIRNLQPALIWKWFDQICQIPHPSYHEQALAKFIMDWAISQGLWVEQDDAGNVLIRKPATMGMENRRSVVLQAHLDMVPQANADTHHNFETDPIQPYIDGDWVTAKGTTLGADNGIGVACALAILESDLPHGDLEVLFTVSEETGMEGAVGLRHNWLHSDLMVNLDTEDNGEIYVGCAGGENANFEIPFTTVANNYQHCCQIKLSGLRGGHSGCDIHLNCGNAIKLLVRFLAQLNSQIPNLDFSLQEIHGGSIRNAIPREAEAIIVFNGDKSALCQAVADFEKTLQQEFAYTEKNLSFKCHEATKAEQVFNSANAQQIIHSLNVLPCGVIRNSDAVTNTVETSLSVGVLTMKNNAIHTVILIRSLVESGAKEVRAKLQSLAQISGSKVAFSGYYPGWEPQPNSPLLNLTQDCYREILGYDPAIKVIHAGLECGLLKQHYPSLEVVSVGPTIRNAHSPDEKVNIQAVAVFWQLMSSMLANMLTK